MKFSKYKQKTAFLDERKRELTNKIILDLNEKYKDFLNKKVKLHTTNVSQPYAICYFKGFINHRETVTIVLNAVKKNGKEAERSAYILSLYLDYDNLKMELIS